MVEAIRLRVSEPVPRVRLRVLPSLLPTQIELRNTGTEIQWRYIDGSSDWITLIEVIDLLPLPADILAELLTVDGTGSGLDADFLDGLDSTAFEKVSKTTQVVTTNGTTAIAATTDEVVLNLAAPDIATLQLGTVASRGGRELSVTQWNANATATVAADAGDPGGIKGVPSIDLVPGTTVIFAPITALSGWTF